MKQTTDEIDFLILQTLEKVKAQQTAIAQRLGKVEGDLNVVQVEQKKLEINVPSPGQTPQNMPTAKQVDDLNKRLDGVTKLLEKFAK